MAQFGQFLTNLMSGPSGGPDGSRTQHHSQHPHLQLQAVAASIVQQQQQQSASQHPMQFFWTGPIVAPVVHHHHLYPVAVPSSAPTLGHHNSMKHHQQQPHSIVSHISSQHRRNSHQNSSSHHYKSMQSSSTSSQQSEVPVKQTTASSKALNSECNSSENTSEEKIEQTAAISPALSTTSADQNRPESGCCDVQSQSSTCSSSVPPSSTYFASVSAPSDASSPACVSPFSEQSKCETETTLANVDVVEEVIDDVKTPEVASQVTKTKEKVAHSTGNSLNSQRSEQRSSQLRASNPIVQLPLYQQPMSGQLMNQFGSYGPSSQHIGSGNSYSGNLPLPSSASTANSLAYFATQLYHLSQTVPVSQQVPLLSQCPSSVPAPQLQVHSQLTAPTHSMSIPFTQQTMRDHFNALGVSYIAIPWNQSYGMERVWMSEFKRIFSGFHTELWAIQPVERKPNGHKFKMYHDSAKVRFCCDHCGHSWTSMKGRIIFWFTLIPPNFHSGFVGIRLFGQKCEACKSEGFEQPMWYPEEVTKVLMNLYNSVGQNYYGFDKTKFEKQRRVGKPRTPHNKYLCQACAEGICLRRKSSGTLSSSTPSQQQQQQQQQQNNNYHPAIVQKKSSSIEVNEETPAPISEDADKSTKTISTSLNVEIGSSEPVHVIFSDSDDSLDSGILDSDHNTSSSLDKVHQKSAAAAAPSSTTTTAALSGQQQQQKEVEETPVLCVPPTETA